MKAGVFPASGSADSVDADKNVRAPWENVDSAADCSVDGLQRLFKMVRWAASSAAAGALTLLKIGTREQRRHRRNDQ